MIIGCIRGSSRLDGEGALVAVWGEEEEEEEAMRQQGEPRREQLLWEGGEVALACGAQSSVPRTRLKER